jgi:ABC-type branched-subunit amino acid transport system ATPase component
MSGTALLRFADVAGGYGSAEVLRGVSGSVAAGEVLAVIGRNGVGKSSLLKLLSGHLQTWRGSVELIDERVERLSPPQRHERGLAYCQQERPVFDTLSVRDNLTLGMKAPALPAMREFLDRFPVLERRLSQQAGTLSGGEKKLLAFSRCLAEGQPVVLLDEPSEGVQWENIVHMAALIDEHRARGTAFVLVEQNLEFATKLADRYLVMDQGRCVVSGSSDALGRDELLAHLHV